PQAAHHAPAEARKRHALALRLADLAADDSLAASALANLGYHEIRRGRLGVAKQILESALARAGSSDATRNVVLVNLGLVYKLQGDLRTAERLYAQALA